MVVDSPFEGDSVLSPSGEVVISRLAGPEGKSLGYVLRRVSTERFDDNYIIKTDQLLARICTPGAKANISYDERFFVTLVLVAIVTSLIAGAWFHYAVRRNLPLLDDNS